MTKNQNIIEEEIVEVEQSIQSAPEPYKVSTVFSRLQADASVYSDGTGRGVSLLVQETDPDPSYPRMVDIHLDDAAEIRRMADWFTRVAEWAEQGKPVEPSVNNTWRVIPG